MVQSKIDLKTAIEAAKSSARDVLGWNTPQVEEIEREAYSGHDAWAITLSDGGVPILGFALQSPYKRFFVDADTGDVLGLIIRKAS